LSFVKKTRRTGLREISGGQTSGKNSGDLFSAFFKTIRALLTLAIAKGGDAGKPEGANFIDLPKKQ